MSSMKACIIKKVCAMSRTEKCQLLNEIIQPFGYQYFPCEDLFVSELDAWQREFGYTHSYDKAAPYLNMVFDSEPVYFNYRNRTWLIEFWKGQYGINTGAEIGIYCADKIIEPDQRKQQFFHSVSEKDLPIFSIKLYRHSSGRCERLADISMRHWWLAVFRMGCFSHPYELFANICIRFPDCDMCSAFTEALKSLGYDECDIKIKSSCICFSYGTPMTPGHCGILTRFVRRNAQWKNKLFCKLYLFMTRCFCSTLDRAIYLYFYLPFIFRHCLRLRRCRKHFCRKGMGEVS